MRTAKQLNKQRNARSKSRGSHKKRRME